MWQFHGHVDELGLGQLEAGDRTSELGALSRVVERALPGRPGRAHRSPDDPVARLRQACQRRPEAGRAGQHGVGGQPDIVEHQLAGDRRPQRQLVTDGVGGETRGVGGHDESADSVVGGGPHDRHVGDRAVGDPHLAPGDHPVRTIASRPGFHRGRVGADVGLGEPEAAEQVTGGHAGQPLPLLLVGAKARDGEHRQRTLYRHQRPDAGVGGLQLPAGQAIVHRRRAATAVAVQLHSQQSEFAELFGQIARDR